jgi:hypothetical protein
VYRPAQVRKPLRLRRLATFGSCLPPAPPPVFGPSLRETRSTWRRGRFQFQESRLCAAARLQRKPQFRSSAEVCHHFEQEGRSARRRRVCGGSSIQPRNQGWTAGRPECFFNDVNDHDSRSGTVSGGRSGSGEVALARTSRSSGSALARRFKLSKAPTLAS